MKLNYGDFAAQQVSERIGTPVDTLTTLKAIPADRRVAGQIFLVLADNSLWKFHSSSTLTGDDVLVATPGAGSGRFLRMPGADKFELAFTFATADAAVLLTMQAGQELAVERVLWRISADMTGGTASAIGVSSNKTTPTNWSTKGDILGGATGDVAATLVASGGLLAGTIGADMDTLTKTRGLVLKATDTLKFDRITSAFTAGSGSVVVVGTLMRNDGA